MVLRCVLTSCRLQEARHNGRALFSRPIPLKPHLRTVVDRHVIRVQILDLADQIIGQRAALDLPGPPRGLVAAQGRQLDAEMAVDHAN